MKRQSLTLLLLGVLACSQTRDGKQRSESESSGLGGKGDSESGGSTSEADPSGGASEGGKASTGGEGTGGADTGGDSSTGGKGTGGKGGDSSTGGKGTGGAETGGAETGGAETGGEPGTGGENTGGTGGDSGTGGGETGGDSGTGGEGTGGAATGGDSGTGGEGTGGADTGGTAGSGGAGGEPALPTVVTSGPANYWNESTPKVGVGTPSITVVPGTTLGHWFGFGGMFSEAGWDALGELSQADRQLALRLLFDSDEGAAFHYGGIPIGASDYALDRYSLNEEEDDFDMSEFSIERDRQHLIPFIQAALAVNPDMEFFALPFSPPTWMKSPAGFDGGAMKSDPEVFDAHALYLARFVEEYEKENIFIKAVMPQHEPGFTQGYPTCSWSGVQFETYIESSLGPLFSSRLPDREIWLGALSNTSSDAIVDAVMGNATARGYVKALGLQWGMVAYTTDYAQKYGVPILQITHRCGNYPWQGNDQTRAPNDYDYGLESWDLIKEWIDQGVSGYIATNIVLDTIGINLDKSRRWAQNALLTVDRNANTLIPTPAYYVFRHVSQFVEPGSVRIQVTGGDALAWKNPDGSVVTVVHNGAPTPTTVTLDVGGTLLQAEIPSTGWGTFLSP